MKSHFSTCCAARTSPEKWFWKFSIQNISLVKVSWCRVLVVSVPPTPPPTFKTASFLLLWWLPPALFGITCWFLCTMSPTASAWRIWNLVISCFLSALCTTYVLWSLPFSSRQVPVYSCVSAVIDFYFVHSLVQLSDQLSVKAFWPILHLLGTLVEAVPNVAHSLVTQYGEMTQHTPNHISFIQLLVFEGKQKCVFVWM